MKWLFEHFQIVAVIVVALASLVKYRKDLAKTEEEERRAREEMAEDQELLGSEPDIHRPLPSVPPPPARYMVTPVVKKATVPSIRPGPISQAGPSADALILKQQQDIEERLRQIRATKAATTGGAVATRSRVSAAQRHPKAAPAAKSGLRASLHSRKEIRRAIVMREILSPPLGLR